MIETPVQAAPMEPPPAEFNALINGTLRDIYTQAFHAAATQLKTPLPDVAKGLLVFEKFFTAHEDVLKLPDDQRRKRIGERIRLRRQALKLTQRDVADKMKIAPQTLSLWEIGEREPAIRGLIGLSKALDVSTDWLLGITP